MFWFLHFVDDDLSYGRILYKKLLVLMLLGREQYCISYFATIFMFVYLSTRYCVFFGWFTSTVLESSPKKRLMIIRQNWGWPYHEPPFLWSEGECTTATSLSNRKISPGNFCRQFFGKINPGGWNPKANHLGLEWCIKPCKWNKLSIPQLVSWIRISGCHQQYVGL